MPFSKAICPGGNIIARLYFELLYYDVTVQHVSYDNMRPKEMNTMQKEPDFIKIDIMCHSFSHVPRV